MTGPSPDAAHPAVGEPRSGRSRRGPEGEVGVFAADEQSAEPVEVHRWVRLAREVLVAEGVRGDAELSLRFVDETTIADLNRRFRETEGSTDVLAFPIDDPVTAGRWPAGGTTGPDRDREPGDPPLLLGDVVVCPTVAARQARTHAGSYEDEMALLVVHGILHLLGHDHAEAEQQAIMEGRQRELLDRFHYRKP